MKHFVSLIKSWGVSEVTLSRRYLLAQICALGGAFKRNTRTRYYLFASRCPM